MSFNSEKLAGTFCPMIRKTCIKSRCALWTKVSGKNPQSKEILDHWGCAFAWLPILLIENAQMSKQSGAATENMRNEIISRMDSSRIIVREGNGRKAISGV